MDVVDLATEVEEAVGGGRQQLLGQLAELESQRQRVREVLMILDRQIEEASRLLLSVEELTGRAPQLSLDTERDDLRGRRLRDVAVQILRARRQPGAPIHYTEWFDHVTSAGFRVAGQDPLALFLTTVSRAPEIQSYRRRSGLYFLKTAAELAA